jgi:hypothetical protein
MTLKYNITSKLTTEIVNAMKTARPEGGQMVTGTRDESVA